MVNESPKQLTYGTAHQLVHSWIENKNLLKHCYAVEAAMEAYAEKFDAEDVELWKISGLIHDADWEKWPDEHPNHLIEWLRDREVPDSLINAVAAHGFEFNIEPTSSMAKTLRAVDELTGLIVAVTLVRESKSINDVTVDHILKKWNKSGFAKGVRRSDIEKGAQEIGVDLREHIAFVLKAMQSISDKLGL